MLVFDVRAFVFFLLLRTSFISFIYKGVLSLHYIKTAFFIATFGFSVFLTVPTTLYAQHVPNSIVEDVNRYVFEVVVPKESSENVVYETTFLPDLVSYKDRLDAYYSIGSAFLLNTGEFVTGAHVLDVFFNAIHKSAAIRTCDGRVYPIRNIYKASNAEDFIVFDVVGGNFGKKGLAPNISPVLNSKVFAVGNSLGDGVVIREGLYTSKTPEEHAGNWSWIRFSAAASPGNSGGPLLDQEGRVIGVILRKSRSENLNYALPIQNVLQARQNHASYFFKNKVQLLNLQAFPEMAVTTYNFSLPLSESEFRAKSSFFFMPRYKEVIEGILTKNAQQLFPNGDKSDFLLSIGPVPMALPRIIGLNESGGVWSDYIPESVHTITLENNGSLISGQLYGYPMGLLVLPEGLSMATVLNTPEKLMDIFLNSGWIRRQFESQGVSFRSIGRMLTEEQLTDRHGRHWIIQKWPIFYTNHVMLIALLPTPQGVVFVSYFDVPGADYNIEDIRQVTNFVAVNFAGTTKEWKTYLNLGDDWVAKSFRNWSVSAKKNEILLTTTFGKLRVSDGLITVDDKVQIVASFGFYERANTRGNYEIGRIDIIDSNNVNLFVHRMRKPLPNAHKELKEKWRKASAKKYPYNGAVHTIDNGWSMSQMPNSKIAKSNHDEIVISAIVHDSQTIDFKKQLQLWVKNVSLDFSQQCR
jgi:hypothetical protein